MEKGIEKLRTIIHKQIELDITDIKTINNCLEQISKWPWKPKDIIEINSPVDLEFTAKSPELVKRLCDHIEYLYELLGHARNIINSAGLEE